MSDTRHTVANTEQLAQRRAQVAALRLMHYTQKEIADRLGVTQPTISTDLKAVRDEWAERRDEHYTEWVAEELAKLDALEKTWLPRALSRDADDKALTKVLQIMERRARMLGLDQPEKFLHQVVTVDMIDAEIQRLERQLQTVGGEVYELEAGDDEDNE